MATNPLSAFFEGFQGARQNVQARQQQAVENELSQQLRQIQLMRAQQEISQQPMQQALLAEQLRKAMMTPEQVALENAKASYIQRQAAQPGVIYQEGGPVEEISPQAQEIIGMREIAAEQAGIPFTREGISGIEMQTAVPGLPGAVRSPAALRQEQEQAITSASLKRLLEGPEKLEFKDVGDAVVGFNTITGAEVSRTPKVPGKELTKTARGLFEYNPLNPSEGRIIPGTEPTTQTADVKLLPDEKKIVETLGTKNASKISIANQIDETAKILENPKLDNTTKIKEGQRLLKVLNSSEGVDAVGVEESKRLGSLIEYQILNLRGFVDPTQQVTGVNLPGYTEQIKTASSAIKGSVMANEAVINGIYGKYGIKPSAGISSIPAPVGKITIEQASAILQEAGGDKVKARQIATERGLKF